MTTQALRIAIIGSGPSGFYAADHLLKQKETNLNLEIDMFDKLPTPYGLVRGGVAPDHPKIKSVTKVYEKIAADPRFRFYGNVEIGRHITHADLKQHYHAIIYAVGAQSDRKLGVPGEDLLGSDAATEFVGWYNAHPEFRDLTFDLSAESVAVIGNGNVAMDVARILASTPEELGVTDIADYALEALRSSKVKDIYIIGRRGPAQAAFTNPELKEFGELHDADVIVTPEDAAIDPLSAAQMQEKPDAVVVKNTDMLKAYSTRQPAGKSRRVHFNFALSPTELIGENGKVTGIKLVKNDLIAGADGSIKAKATDQSFTLPVQLVFRSIGYMGVPTPGVPFDARAGIIPNDHGRVIDPAQNNAVLPGEYVVGWIKRGPSGVIGTNKPDSIETANMLLADVMQMPDLADTTKTRAAIDALIKEKQPDYVTFADWQILDRAETDLGTAQGRPRVKFSTIPSMLDAIREKKRDLNPLS